MRNLTLMLVLFVGMTQALAQAPNIEIDLTATEVTSQGQTGTCWSFSTTSFLESEVARLTGELHDLSEMAAVRVIYPEKVERFVRYQGKHQFGPGGLCHDVIHAADVYGLVPQAVYAGGQEPGSYNHSELDAVLESMVQAMVKQSGSISPASIAVVSGTLDAYLGALPTEFNYQGKNYTPQSFRKAMKINHANYVSLTSFTHHPFGSRFILEVPDNHAHGLFLNVPIEELEATVNEALDHGMTVAWDADVSNKGFSFSKGWAIMPETAKTADDWKTLDSMPVEPSVTQATRQEDFDEQSTTDDHLMHLVGRARDTQGRPYFIIKNSWGDGNEYGGRQFVSMEYFRHHTIAIMLHRDGLSKGARNMIVKKLTK